MGGISTIGLDIAKSVFQVHGVDADGAVVIRKRVNRAKVLEFFAALPPCFVGIEACPIGHHWSRRLQTLGHTVRLMPPSHVKAYLKRSENDANDAVAICQAVMRPSMLLVAWAMQIARRRGLKKAIVALAGRLSVIMHLIWVDGTVFRSTREVVAA
jgi:transposase